MSMTERGATAPPATVYARRLRDWALLLLALLPAFMALASRSAPAVVAAAACLAVVATVFAAERGDFAAALRRRLTTPLGLLGSAFVTLAIVSLIWSAHSRVSLFALGEALVSALASFALLTALARVEPPRWFLLVAAAAFAAAAVVVVAELSSEMALRRSLGTQAPAHVFNRTVMTLLIVYWPLVIMFVRRGLKPVALILGIFLFIAVVRAHSGAAMLGLATAVLMYGLTRVARRAALAVVAVVLGLAFVLAPVKGELADSLLPTGFVDTLAPAHARDRIEIWQSFGEAIRRRPFLGTGFGTSVALAGDPVAAEVPEGRRRVLLGVGHAHDQIVQIWTELGAIGALLAAAVAALVMWRLWRLPTPALAPRLACLAAVVTIAAVGHGAWQGWWIAVLGVAILLFRLAGDTEEEPAHGRP
jgi:exopolysaccharide production protein ExoQ